MLKMNINYLIIINIIIFKVINFQNPRNLSFIIYCSKGMEE